TIFLAASGLAAPLGPAAHNATAASEIKSVLVIALLLLACRLVVGTAVVSGEIGHVLVGQGRGNRLHRWMAALPALICLECFDDVRGVLTADDGNAVHLGIRSTPARNAVTTATHLGFLVPGGGIALDGGHLAKCNGRHHEHCHGRAD